MAKQGGTDSVKQIATKLVKIMKACSYVQKTGKNTFHNYKYATAADVLEKANDAMVENGVACFVSPELVEFRDVTTAKGATEHLATVRAAVTLVDSESGETMVIVGIGSGQDSGDKAVMKAQTAAIKYAWMMSLNISTGDDPEADEGVDQRTTPAPANNPLPAPPVAPMPPISDAQRKKIFALVGEIGWTKEQAKESIEVTYGVDSTSKLTMQQAKDFIDFLDKKKGASK